jgi:type VI secretion system protein ImpC
MGERPEDEAVGTEQATEQGTEHAGPPQELLDAVLDQTTMDNVIKASKARTSSQKSQIEGMLQALVGEVVSGHVQKTESLEEALDVAIARMDDLLTKQLNPILHHDEFQKVEATWRGLHFLIHQSETGQMIKIRVLDVNKKDLRDDLMKAAEFDQSGLFKAIYESEFGTPGGKPYGALLGDFYFGNNDPDLALLERISEVASAAHAPFFASPDPSMLGMDSFTELMDPRDLAKKFESPDYARWRSFRQKTESCYVGLTLPRTLGRLPYGEKTDPIEAFNFEEDASGETHDNYLWSNASWSFGARLTDAFAQHGWCTAITGANSGGRVEGLPVHTFKTDDGTIAAKCPTEIAITDRRDAELDRLGFIPLCHYKDTDYAVFFAAQSVNKPDEFEEDWASSNAALTAKIPYVMAISRFAHYLKVIQRDNLGSFREREDVEKELQNWISNYVLLDPSSAGQELKAKKPLSEAKVTVHDVPGKPGHYKATMLLRPHFMLEDLEISLRLVADLDQPS